MREHSELLFRRADGDEVWTIFSSNLLVDEEGRFIRSLGMVTDITDLKEDAPRILRRAQHDLLNRLPNRELLTDRRGKLRLSRGDSGAW